MHSYFSNVCFWSPAFDSLILRKFSRRVSQFGMTLPFFMFIAETDEQPIPVDGNPGCIESLIPFLPFGNYIRVLSKKEYSYRSLFFSHIKILICYAAY